MTPQETLDLTGKLLVAMPGMEDTRFAHSVIYMTSHGDDGAVGLMINRPAPELRLSDVLDQLVEGPVLSTATLGVHIGGPVERGRGFVLHSDEYDCDSATLNVAPGIALTATITILADIAAGKGPAQALLLLGYAGWGPGQLEGEIAQNGWLTCDAPDALLFETPDDKKWTAALNSIGIDPLGLSSTAGRA